jgi:putative membrane protein insertion efficiency factor
MQKTLIISIRAYQYLLSPFLANSCRYIPTCSQFAIEAIKEHGVIKGLFLTTKRLSCCHPWHVGGYDPVPQSKTTNAKI